MNNSNSKKTPWPKYLPYTPIAMGMIQPEWIFMSHFFEENEVESSATKKLQPQQSISSPTLPTSSPIRISIRPRKPPKTFGS